MRASRAKRRRAFGARDVDVLAKPEGNLKTDTAPVTLSAYELQVLREERQRAAVRERGRSLVV
jgi:hypothetical protein